MYVVLERIIKFELSLVDVFWTIICSIIFGFIFLLGSLLSLGSWIFYLFHCFYMSNLISLGNAFISLEISSQFLIFFSLFSFILAWTFISLQIKEFRIMGLSINNSVYSCVFFFLTGLHFFHLLLGVLLFIILLWSCSFPFLFDGSKEEW